MRAAGSYIRINLISAIIAISLVIPVFASYAANIDVKPAVPASRLRTDYASGYTKEKIKAAYISMIRDEGTVIGEVMILDFGSGRACRNAHEDFTDKISLERVLAVRTSEISSRQSATIIERDGYYYCLTMKGSRLTFAKAKSEEAAFDAVRLSRVKRGFPGGLLGKIILLALIIWGIKSIKKPLFGALAWILKKLWKFAGRIFIFALLCIVLFWALRVGVFVFQRVKFKISSVMSAKEQPIQQAVESVPEPEAPEPIPQEIPAEEVTTYETPKVETVEEPVTAKVLEGPPYVQPEGEDTLTFLCRSEVLLDIGNKYWIEHYNNQGVNFISLNITSPPYPRDINANGDAAVAAFVADMRFDQWVDERVYQYFLVVRNSDRTWRVITTHNGVTREMIEQYGMDPDKVGR